MAASRTGWLIDESLDGKGVDRTDISHTTGERIGGGLRLLGGAKHRDRERGIAHRGQGHARSPAPVRERDRGDDRVVFHHDKSTGAEARIDSGISRHGVNIRCDACDGRTRLGPMKIAHLASGGWYHYGVRTMRVIAWAIACVLCVAALSACGGSGDDADTENVAVSLDGAPLLTAEEVAAAVLISNTGPNATAPTPGTEAYDRTVAASLGTLIEESVAAREAERRGIAVKETTVREQLEGLRRACCTKDEEWATLLEDAGVNEADVAEMLERRAAAFALRARLATSTQTPTEQELRAAWAAQRDAFRTPRQRLVSVISTPDEAAARRAAAQLARGADFRDVARAVSRDPSAGGGGQVLMSEGGGYPDAVVEAAFALPREDATPTPVKIGGQWYLLGSLGPVEEARNLSFEEAREQLASYVASRAAEQEYQALVASLLKDAGEVTFGPGYQPSAASLVPGAAPGAATTTAP